MAAWITRTALAAMTALAGACADIGQPAEESCAVGLYGPEGGEPVAALVMREDGARVSRLSGEVRRIDLESVCSGGTLVLADGETLIRTPLRVTDTRFEAGDVTLAGQLLMRPDLPGDAPLVVLAHGSEESGWIGQADYPFLLAAQGLAVFVYDKRGTGLSRGLYSQNFPELADDLVAASREAKRLADGRHGRFGLMGFSQGGWIVPLAAERAGADFIGVGYGLVVDITEEDAEQVERELRELGYGEDVIAKARSVTDATGRIARSGYRDGLDELDRLKSAYGNEPWFAEINGGFSGVILSIPTETLRREGIPMFDLLRIDWSLDPVEVLRAVQVPQLWALAAEDSEAPIGKTLSRLKSLREEGADIDIYLFPEADHGMWLPGRDGDGDDMVGRRAPGYLQLMADWARGEVEGPYGEAEPR